MKRIVVCLAIVFNLLCAETALSEFDQNNNRIFELFADNIDTIEHKTMIATGNAVIISQDVYVIADYIKYDTEARNADMNGNVKFYRDGMLFFTTQSASVKFDENHAVIEPFYMQDSESGIWISASFAEQNGDEYEFKEVVVSGCDVDSPIWHIEGTTGYYDNESSFASIWNPRIYIKTIPVLWLPYLFISTKHKRSTGFLYPEFATSSIEGFSYLQPFFLALDDNWDMTFTPQIRTSRGYGLYTEARLVDEFNKLFYFKTGIFQNFTRYKRKYDAQNLTIFGFEFNHERRDLLNELISTESDGLYLDFNYMNDLDYIRLETTKDKEIENRIQTSKANYFTSFGDHYLGLYFKYFLDLSKLKNNETLQTLPHFQYHRYLEAAEDFDSFMYSVDVNSKNVMSGVKFGYFENSVDVPLSIQTYILAGYLTIGATADISANVINTYNADKQPSGSVYYNYTNGTSTYFGTSVGVFATSDIARQYDKVFHTMHFSASFNTPLYEYSKDNNGMFASENQNGVISILNDTFQEEQKVELGFSQYFFGLEGVDLVYHRMYQEINPTDSQSKLGNLRNELGFSPIENIDIATTLYYSWFYNTIEEASISLRAKAGYFNSSLTYYLKKQFTYYDTREKYTEEAANYMRLRMSYDFGYFAVYGNIGYDFKDKYIRDWDISISKDIRCFGIGLRFANDLTPILTTSGTRTINNRYISLELRFVPVVATSITHNFD